MKLLCISRNNKTKGNINLLCKLHNSKLPKKKKRTLSSSMITHENKDQEKKKGIVN